LDKRFVWSITTAQATDFWSR